jgi:hypothetical protein
MVFLLLAERAVAAPRKSAASRRGRVGQAVSPAKG